MCGIVGYWSEKGEAFSVLLRALQKLEYRGYDSFGFATLGPEGIEVEKNIGKISEATCEGIGGTKGIGHTRWATHGKVTKVNSHPHRDCSGNIAVVHNGIIENHEALRKHLNTSSHTFQSETDTELLAHLLEEGMKKGQSLQEAVMTIAPMIEGRNAFVAISHGTGEMVALRNGSPLILGIRQVENSREIFIASDIPAFLDKTNKVIYLDDGQLCVINKELAFYDFVTEARVEKRVIEIQWSKQTADKGAYEHFMLKEIMEQKESVINAARQDSSALLRVAEMINKAKGVFFIGCGTAARVCHTAEYLFSQVANKHVNFVQASEFENYKHFLIPESLVIAVSQSGETADVLEALSAAKEKGVTIVSVLNSVGSSMERISDFTFHIRAGPEQAVASTKATTSQLAVLIMLAHACVGKLNEADRLLVELSGKINDMLNPRYEEHIRKIAEDISEHNSIFIIGRGINYPLAKESAIKIMEVSYIHAQGFAGGELKHGPIAMIEEGTPVIVLVAEDDNKEAIMSNAMEVKSRGATIIGIGSEPHAVFDYWIRTPKADAAVSPIASLIPVQLLAYYLGVHKGNDVDYPKNLAKSVTVK